MAIEALGNTDPRRDGKLKNGLRLRNGIWYLRFMHAGRLVVGSTGCSDRRSAETYLLRLKSSLALEGSITPDGWYTAPTTAGTYTVTAISDVSPGVFGVITVVVLPVQILISPRNVTLAKNATYKFFGASTAGPLEWSTAGGGSITQDGTYTAPTVDGTYTVTATSSLQSSTFATATVVVQDGGLSGGGYGGSGVTPPTPITGGVNIEPALPPSMPAGTYQAFSAKVFGGDDQGVDWTVERNIVDPKTGQPSGSVDKSGVFTAGFAGYYLVKATSKANPQSYGTALVMVESGVNRLFNTPAALNREQYSLTALKDGRILLAGGSDGTNVLGTCYLFDPSTKAFTETGALSISRSGHKAVLLQDGRVMVSQGYGNLDLVGDSSLHGMGSLPHSEVYDPASGTWSALPEMTGQTPGGATTWNVNNQGSSLALASGGALVLGGDDLSGNWTSNSTLFDGTGFTSLSWTSLWWGKWFPMVQLKNGLVLSPGGYTGQPRPASSTDDDWPIMNQALLYNPLDGTNSTTTYPMANKRMGHTATLLADGRVLVVGGITHNVKAYGQVGADQWVPTATCEIYDPAVGGFTATGSLLYPKTNHAAILMPTGQVMVLGGWSEMAADGTLTYYNDVETFDPDTGTWRVTDVLINGPDAYGLDNPKLALQPEGGVFIGGKPIISPVQIVQSLNQPANPKSVQAICAKWSNGADKQRMSGNTELLGSTISVINLLAIGAVPPSAEIEFVTINQGVERYIDADNRQSRISIWKNMPWKANVPIVKGRPGLFRIYLKDSFYSGKTKIKIRLEVNRGQYVCDRDIIVDAKNLNNLNSFWTLKGSMATFEAFDKNLLINEGHVRILRDPGSAMEKVLFEGDLIMQKSLPIVIHVAKGFYIWTDQYGNKHDDTIDIAKVIPKFKSEIISIYPVAESDVNVEMISGGQFADQVEWTNAITWDKGKDGLLTGDNYEQLLYRWHQFTTTHFGAKPVRSYYLLLMPLIFNEALEGVRGETPGNNDHCSVVSIPVDGGQDRVDFYPVSHELGHQHGLMHPNSPGTSEYYRILWNDAPGTDMMKVQAYTELIDRNFPNKFSEYAKNLKDPNVTGQIGVRGLNLSGLSSTIDMQPYRSDIDATNELLWFDFMAYDTHTWISDYNYFNLYKYNNP